VLLGAAVAGASEKLDDCVYGEKELKSLLPTSVIAEIPLFGVPALKRTEQKMSWLGWATAAVVFSVILAGSAFSYLKG